MKRVAILLRRMKTDNDDAERFGIKKDIIDVLKLYNVNYFLVALDTISNDDYLNVIEMINMADGVIIPGGSLGGNMEHKVIRYLYDNDIPTLGICYGMQSMGSAFGGSLKRIENHKVMNLKCAHSVIINKGSLLYQILKKEYIVVNSRHNYAVFNPNLSISAVSYDGIIEAIEDKNKRFFIGIQWHPENLTDGINKSIFDYFVSKL